MKWVAVAAALCGCNQVFDIKTTSIGDASRQLFDAPTDAAPHCPPIGTAPKFSKLFHQLDVSGCHDYQTSPAIDLALANCANAPSGVGVGRIDDEMSAALGFDPGVFIGTDVRLAPEGNLAYMVLVPNGGFTAYSVAEYDRDALGTWTTGPLIPIALSIVGTISTMTRASLGRHLFTSNIDGELDEYVEDGQAQWSVAAIYGAADFGLSSAGALQLSPDGLRMVLEGVPLTDTVTRTYYVDRADLSSRFATATQIDAVPGVTDPFMTEDCGRLYFSAIDTVFYVEQE